ncbi:bifunctional enoyl-CoA hydratase/phosphate acetyltransferase [Ahrensia sp. R2A130]|uniref:bifunctional enoyl-CoA hydratase/phosphate acetyltransferase n=1 Tax=Ahrensia sp. R2A130 TaxID=744979 RepID=UPI0001E08CB3|nr:bifunctional enoyl-CoA hydratase/phosphate acetyltransferase [Ahrensia sp. R2A130]EFL88141.1 phosphate butyryltransferase [Ahrensia sp. R2A130]
MTDAATDMSNRPHFTTMLERCKPLPPLRTALVCPHEKTALGGALEARDLGLIEPVLVGESARIQQVAQKNGFDISGLTIVEARGEAGAAHAGVDCVADGRAQAIMKGDVHSDTYLAAVIRRENGMRTANRTSHCFVMDIPNWPKPVIITDAALNVAPDVKNRIAITKNAIKLAHALSVTEPKVAVLSAVESVNAAIPSSAEAKEIADHGYENAIVGGPFALDNAVSARAAKLKGITNPAAGDADILVVPTIEAGNILFKALVYMAGAETGGLVVGASAPVILTSRADSAEARIASCALAVLMANAA